MSLHFREKNFAGSRLLPLFVLVDPRASHMARAGLSSSSVAGVLSRCRAALRHARIRNLPVAFVCNVPRRTRRAGRLWIREMEPLPSDVMFERRGDSCYSSPYFAEAADMAGELVVAGFFRGGGCFPTAVDGVAAGHRIAFLRDAIETSASERDGLASVLAMTNATPKGPVRAPTTAMWRTETDGPHFQVASKSGDSGRAFPV